MHKSSSAAAAIVVLALGILTSPAHAYLTLQLDSSTVLGDYTYKVWLEPTFALAEGAEVHLVDFAGYVPGTVRFDRMPLLSLGTFVPSVVAQSSGMILPPGATDSADVPNLVLTFEGDAPGAFDTRVLTGYLYALSTAPLASPDTGPFLPYTSADTVTSGGSPGLPAFAQGFVTGPAIPEPATAALLLVGVATTTLRRRR